MDYTFCWQQFNVHPQFAFFSLNLADFDVKIAIADITTGRNRISKFLTANQESLNPKEFTNRKGINVTNRIPKIKDTIAIVFETTSVLNSDSPYFLAYHPVAEINKHTGGARSIDTLNLCVNIITIPATDVTAKIINVNHAHTLTIVPLITYTLI